MKRSTLILGLALLTMAATTFMVLADAVAGGRGPDPRPGGAWAFDRVRVLKGLNLGRFAFSSFRPPDNVPDITIPNTFTIPSALSFYNLSSAGAVTSDQTTAISDGQVLWQTLLLRNGGSYDITFRDNANVQVKDNTSYVLGSTDYLSFLWNGTDWDQTGGSDN